MSFSQAEFDAVYEAAGNILNDIGLGAGAFTIEPQAGMWALRLERVTPAGKTTASIPFDHHQLKESLDDHEARVHLRHDWTIKLAAWREVVLRDA